jgi:2-dehydropantoate 2-reductase
MRIVILGPGALGSLCGATLHAGGHDVVLLGRPSPHLEVLRDEGLAFRRRDGTAARLRIPVSDDPSVVADADLIIVLVKSYDTSEAAHAIASFVRAGQAILTLQNGLGNAERIRAEVGDGPRVLVGVTSQGATRVGPGAIVHAGEGATLIGFADENDEPLVREIAASFSAAGLPTAAVAEIEPWVWRKLAVNAAINGLTALGGVTNGIIAADEALLAAAETVAEEAAAVARARGWELGGMRHAVAETATVTAANRSSMLQDLEAGRRTEVAAIHEAIVAAGAAAGIATPVTAVLAALIRARERAATTEGMGDG